MEQNANSLYFGSRKVKTFGEASNGQVWVEYDDGGREIMGAAEWEKKSEAPVEENFEFDKGRVMPAVKDLLEVVYKHNLRLEDLSLVFRVMIDSIQLAVDQAKEIAIGQPAWTVRVDDIQKILDDAKAIGEKKLQTDVLRAVQGNVIRY